MRILKKDREAILRDFSVHLANRNMRKTDERLLILDAICRSTTPVSVGFLYRYFSMASYPISKVTIYNTLNLLLQLKYIDAVIVSQKVNYMISKKANNMNHIDIILGLQWGDEGKGKIVDTLCENYDIIARFQGGPNAGHTLEFDDIKHVLHIIPSGIFHTKKINLIGNGVLIDPVIFAHEIALLRKKNLNPTNNLYIAERAHLILPTHRAMDAALEAQKGNKKIGSTLKGIGPAYTDKTARIGMRVCDGMDKNFLTIYHKLRDHHLTIFKHINFNIDELLIDGKTFADYESEWLESIHILKQFKVVSCEYYINESLLQGKKILAEGAQGSLLDIEYGSYPYVTSSNTMSAAVCTGLGVAPHRIGKVFGVFKAYCTRVGNGPFPTELFDTNGDILRKSGNEYGSTTGRPRRCGWLDIPALNYAVMINGVTELIMTKADVMNNIPDNYICIQYTTNNGCTSQFTNADDDIKPVLKKMQKWDCICNDNKLSKPFTDYLKFIETKTGIDITHISTSPDRKDIIQVTKQKGKYIIL